MRLTNQVDDEARAYIRRDCDLHDPKHQPLSVSTVTERATDSVDGRGMRGRCIVCTNKLHNRWRKERVQSLSSRLLVGGVPCC